MASKERDQIDPEELKDRIVKAIDQEIGTALRRRSEEGSYSRPDVTVGTYTRGD